MVTIYNIVCHFTTVKMWMLNFKYSCGQNQSPTHHLTIVWAGYWFWSHEYLKFSIHIFTTVKWQTILQIVTIFNLQSVLKVLVYIYPNQNLKFWSTFKLYQNVYPYLKWILTFWMHFTLTVISKNLLVCFWSVV